MPAMSSFFTRTLQDKSHLALDLLQGAGTIYAVAKLDLPAVRVVVGAMVAPIKGSHPSNTCTPTQQFGTSGSYLFPALR